MILDFLMRARYPAMSEWENFDMPDDMMFL